MDSPIVLAPLAGGPTTPQLVVAAVEAGALGFLAAGYKTASAVAEDIARVRAATTRPFGVNVFVPGRDDADVRAVAEYAARIGASIADARWSDDDWDAKLALLARERPPVVSFTFGCPGGGVIAELQRGGSAVWVTVTTVEEAGAAAAAGADALVVQGAEAGGHRGSWDDTDEGPAQLHELFAGVREAVGVPLVAAGGIASREAVRDALAAGAAAAQIGTAFMLADEAGTSAPQRRAMRGDAPTALTRAFTGRTARGIVNEFMRDHHAYAPRAYPQVHYLTAPLRAAARAAGDADRMNLWAGTAYREARAEPAAATVARLSP